MTIKEQNNFNNIRTISLFSGAGGLDIGAIKAGAHVVFANDMMKEACLTYKENIGDHIIQGDINTLFDEIGKVDNPDLVVLLVKAFLLLEKWMSMTKEVS